MVQEQVNLLSPKFNKRFLDSHAGKIISDPKVAIVELVANCWDAGATEVYIKWPISTEKYFEISDNGTGMGKEEFESVWFELDYNRLHYQGKEIKVPGMQITRKVYGKNGKGRHGLFSFSKKYKVETCKNELISVFEVQRSLDSSFPYQITFISQEAISAEKHGTKISCSFKKGLIEEENIIDVLELEELLGSKFIVDPSQFKIYVNEKEISERDILGHSTKYICQIPSEKDVEIFVVDSKKVGKDTKQHGVAWWVNNRLVGEQSWKDFDETYLDGRNSAAKRYTIIVTADILEDEVKEDWTGFNESERVKKVKKHVNEKILEVVYEILKEVRKEVKKSVLKLYANQLTGISRTSRNRIGKTIDNIQEACPTIQYNILESIVKMLIKMESARSGYTLLQQISEMSEKEIDLLVDVVNRWDIEEAKVVLDLLGERLDLIEKMRELVEDPNTDELHQLQPLFKRGLWIFGPGYERIDFTSNEKLTTVLTKLFEKKDLSKLKTPNRRPDFVALEDSTIGAYSYEEFDENTAEVIGIKKVLIVELKKGGYTITIDELRQAEDYALEIERSVNEYTKIECYVLGSHINAKSSTRGDNIQIIPMQYHVVLLKAEARTFYLMNKIKKLRDIQSSNDEEINEVVSQKNLTFTNKYTS